MTYLLWSGACFLCTWSIIRFTHDPNASLDVQSGEVILAALGFIVWAVGMVLIGLAL